MQGGVGTLLAGKSESILINRFALAVFLATAIALPAVETCAAIFPQPLHLTREITDSLSGTKEVTDEYAHGDRVVSVGKHRTAIADFARNELTIIDRAANTYSITRFDALAGQYRDRQSVQRVVAPISLRAKNEPRQIAGRSVDTYEGLLPDQTTVRIAADREVILSRTAVEILLGVAYPNRRTPGGDAAIEALHVVARIATTTADGEGSYRLPLEQITRHESEGETLEFRSTVTRIGGETVPALELVIPAGARLVEADALRAPRLLDELDRLPSANRP